MSRRVDISPSVLAGRRAKAQGIKAWQTEVLHHHNIAQFLTLAVADNVDVQQQDIVSVADNVDAQQQSPAGWREIGV